MASVCKDCPIKIKIEYCCGSHPETREQKVVKFKSGERVGVCINLQPDGSCATYWNEETCHGYDCERKYRLGLDCRRDLGI